jgi:hypothetical protein
VPVLDPETLLVNGHPHPAAPRPTLHPPATQPPDNAGEGRKVPALGGGWITVTVVIGVMAALIALGGMVLSFRAVSTEMIPAFGRQWSWLVPIVVDLTVFVFSGVDLVLARLDMSHPLARWTVYGATAGTVYLNYNAAGALPGRVAHVLMPSIWVVFIELMRHVVRVQTNLATGSRRQPIPAVRWMASPWPSVKVWRRMVLWRINSYDTALDQERQRLAAVAVARQLYGRRWRWRIGPLLRLQIALGEANADTVRTAAAEARAMESGRTSVTERDTLDAEVPVATGPRPVAAPGRVHLHVSGRPRAGHRWPRTTRPRSAHGPAVRPSELPTEGRPRPRPRQRNAENGDTAARVAAATAAHPDWSTAQIAQLLGIGQRTARRYRTGH